MAKEAIHLTENNCKVFFVAVAVFAVVLIAPGDYPRGGGAAAAEKQFSTDAVKTTLRRVNGLETQVQRITVEMAQNVLDLDRSAGIKRLQKAYDQFERNLAILAQGDAELGIPAPSDPAIKEALADVQIAWNIFRGNVLRSILKKDSSRANLIILAELDQTVIAATTRARKAFQEKFLKKTMVSLNTLTLIKAERQSYLAGKIASEYWLITLDYEVSRLRPQLAEDVKRFNRVLLGLSKGDPEQQIFKIDDPALQAALSRTQAEWDKVMPQLDSVVAGGALPTHMHERVKGDMERLRVRMEKVVDVLEKL